MNGQASLRGDLSSKTSGGFSGRHLAVRSKMMRSLIKIRSCVLRAARAYFNDNGWVEVTIPTISTIAGSCEDYSTLVSVDYYGRRAFLIQTGQLFMEAIVAGFDKVCSICHSYRAEKNRTNRHLTEFILIEAEAAHCDLPDMMAVMEDLSIGMTNRVRGECAEDLEIVRGDRTEVPRLVAPYPRITYTEAVDLLSRNGLSMTWGQDLGQEGESYLTSQFGGPLFLTHHPKRIKFFNMKEDPTNPDVVLSCDLLMPNAGEVAGASEREDDYSNLRANLLADPYSQRISQIGGRVEDYDWYLDLRRHGSRPHSGFGLGLERYLKWLLNLNDVADAIEFPNQYKRLAPED